MSILTTPDRVAQAHRTGRALILILLAIAGIGTVFGIYGIRIYLVKAERADFYHRIDSLVHQASKLAALTSQGVNNGEFNSQLAAVHAEYDLLKGKWHEQKWPDGYSKFALAIGKWDTVLTFWNIEIKQRSSHFSKDPRLVQSYMEIDPKLRALDFDSDGGAAVNLQLAVRAFMGDASEHFDQAKDSIGSVCFIRAEGLKSPA